MWTKPIELNNTWSDNFGYQRQKDQDAVGFEIEIEGRGITILPGSPENDRFYELWRRAEDGSLRRNSPLDEAWEYRFRAPLSLKDTEIAIAMVCDKFTRKNVVVYDTGRASCHVHVNYANDKMITVYNAITLSVILDELFVSLNGPLRAGNNFCFRAKDAQGLIVSMVKSINRRGDLADFNREYRYSSINVGALFKFSTIEYRSMECTVDYKRLMNWINCLHAIRVAARKFKNPTEIMSQFSARGPDRFLTDILGVTLAMPYLRIANRSQKLFDGLRLVQEFANCSTWVARKKEDRPEKKLKMKRYEDFVQNIQEQMDAAVAAAPAPHPGMVFHVNWDQAPPPIGPADGLVPIQPFNGGGGGNWVHAGPIGGGAQ